MSEDPKHHPTPLMPRSTSAAAEPAEAEQLPSEMPVGISETIRPLIEAAAEKLQEVDDCSDSDPELPALKKAADDAVDEVMTAARTLGGNEVIIPNGWKAGWDNKKREVILTSQDGKEKRVKAHILHTQCPMCGSTGNAVEQEISPVEIDPRDGAEIPMSEVEAQELNRLLYKCLRQAKSDRADINVRMTMEDKNGGPDEVFCLSAKIRLTQERK